MTHAIIEAHPADIHTHMLAIADGDWDALACLEPWLSRWALRAGLRGQDADDAVQETFHLIHVALPTWQPMSPRASYGWLHTLARRAMGSVRQRWHQHIVPLLDDHALTVEPCDPVQLPDIVRHRFDQLSPNERFLVQQHIMHGRSCTDLGRELGRGRASVHKSVSRALAELRACEETPDRGDGRDRRADARKTERSNTGVLRAESDAADAAETAPYPTKGVSSQALSVRPVRPQESV